MSVDLKDSINVAVAGATGYIGLELVKILTKHPKVNITYLCAQKSLGQPIAKIDSKIKTKKLPKISKKNMHKLYDTGVIDVI